MTVAQGLYKLHGVAIMRSPPQGNECNMRSKVYFIAKVCFIEGVGDGFG